MGPVHAASGEAATLPVKPMGRADQPTVLLLGATGRTGGRVLTQLRTRDVPVRVIVRSAERLPHGVADDPGLTVTEADLTSMTRHELARHVKGCDVVISCLGPNLNLKGVYGKPRDLVAGTVERVWRIIEDARLAEAGADHSAPPARPVRLILMSSVSVNRADRQDTHRGWIERAYVWLIRALMPPARDNQRAADFLVHSVGPADPGLDWVVVRPDSLRDGPVSEYALHEGLVDSLFRPGCTNMANVAHFMCDLATDDEVWMTWRGKHPVIVNASSAS